MVDYYPLLNRAIASLGESTAEARAGIYGRARGALERQLRGFDPPLPEDDIAAQLATLEAVITRIESEQGMPAPKPELPVGAALEVPAAEPEPAKASPAPLADTGPAAPAGDPSAAAEQADKPDEAARQDPADKIDPTDKTDPTNKTDDVSTPDRDGAETGRIEPTLAVLPPRDAIIEPVVRPRIPARAESTGPNRKRLALFAGIGLVAMLGMGLLAMTRMNKPAIPSGPPVVTAPAENGTDPAKTEGRLANAEPQPNSQVAPPASAPQPPRPPAAQPAPPAATPPSATSPAGSPAAQRPPEGTVVTQSTIGRAFMVLEPAPGAPNQFEGKVNWTYLPDNSIGGQKSLRALIEFPASTMSVDLSIARNTDSGLGASHIVMVIFDGRAGLGNVLEMSAIEWRERESQVGGILNGTVVPIQANVFMIGLDKAEANVTRNLDLLRTQKWMVFEFRLENGRRGAVLVEKALSGDKAVADALRDWRQ